MSKETLAEASAKADIGTHFKMVQLEQQLQQARNFVSRAINTLEQVQIAIEEDDIDEALRIIKEARGIEE